MPVSMVLRLTRFFAEVKQKISIRCHSEASAAFRHAESLGLSEIVAFATTYLDNINLNKLPRSKLTRYSTSKNNNKKARNIIGPI